MEMTLYEHNYLSDKRNNELWSVMQSDEIKYEYNNACLNSSIIIALKFKWDISLPASQYLETRLVFHIDFLTRNKRIY